MEGLCAAFARSLLSLVRSVSVGLGGTVVAERKFTCGLRLVLATQIRRFATGRELWGGGSDTYVCVIVIRSGWGWIRGRLDRG